MKQQIPSVFFASAHPAKLDRNQTLPARFMRLLERLPIRDRVRGRTVAVKMHMGDGLGYSTIHPLFVKLLIDHIREGKPKDVFATDASVRTASDRGYARETIHARITPAIGHDGRNVTPRKTGWKHMPTVDIGKPVIDADVLINFSHVKGHGDCGFGAACKNLAMGCVPSSSRRSMHSLEGQLAWRRKKCIRCNKCIAECPTHANKFNAKGEYEIFWHHCRMCMHCMLACPTGAIKITGHDFGLFQQALARVTQLVLKEFNPADVFHINVLTHITIYCDCWGFTTPALVPDVGIFASQDIVAVDHASLESIKTANVIPGSITPPYSLGKGKHLFEKIHHKDPYVQVRSMEKLGLGSTKYSIVEVE